jgi:hypothetical protein
MCEINATGESSRHCFFMALLQTNAFVLVRARTYAKQTPCALQLLANKMLEACVRAPYPLWRIDRFMPTHHERARSDTQTHEKNAQVLGTYHFRFQMQNSKHWGRPAVSSALYDHPANTRTQHGAQNTTHHNSRNKSNY